MHRSALKLALTLNYSPPQIQDELAWKTCILLDGNKDSSSHHLPLTYTISHIQ